MNIIRQRRVKPLTFQTFERERLAELAQERCGICTFLYPSSVMTEEDGNRRCPNCAGDVTAEMRAQIAAHDASRIAARQTRPQVSRVALEPTRTGSVTSLTRNDGSRITQSSPLLMTRGVGVTVNVGGANLSTADAATYSTGITNDVPVSYGSATSAVLTIVADVAMTPGDYHLTYNGTTLRGILRVR